MVPVELCVLLFVVGMLLGMWGVAACISGRQSPSSATCRHRFAERPLVTNRKGDVCVELHCEKCGEYGIRWDKSGTAAPKVIPPPGGMITPEFQEMRRRTERTIAAAHAALNKPQCQCSMCAAESESCPAT